MKQFITDSGVIFLRIEQLYYLTELSRYRSLNLAADELHISTQALSASIKNLEIELDTVILERTNRGVSFTEDGEQVLQYAYKTIKGYEDLQRALDKSLSANTAASLNQKGTLLVHSVPVFLESILPCKIKEFQQKYPNVSIQIVQDTTNNICTAVQNNKQSILGMILLPSSKNTLMRTFLPEGNFLFRPISTNRYVCCVAKDSPFAKHKTISIKKILKEPLVIYTTGAAENSPLLCLLKQYTEHLQIASCVSSMTFWAKAIKEHIGIGFLNELFISPQSMVKEVYNDLVFIKLKEPLISVNGFLYTEQLSPLAADFIKQFPVYHPAKGDPVFRTEYLTL